MDEMSQNDWRSLQMVWVIGFNWPAENPKFPLLTLLNPAPNHEEQKFDPMMENCPTLKWIRGDALGDIGLGLGDVCILDNCPFLSDNLLGQIDKDAKGKAVDEAMQITYEMLKVIKPSIIAVCQCSSTWPPWTESRHETR